MYIQIHCIAKLIPSINFATRAVAHILEKESGLPEEKRVVRRHDVGTVTKKDPSHNYPDEEEITVDFTGWGMRVKVMIEVIGTHLVTHHHLRSITVEDIDWICTRKWGPHTFTAEEVQQMKMVTIQP